MPELMLIDKVTRKEIKLPCWRYNKRCEHVKVEIAMLEERKVYVSWPYDNGSAPVEPEDVGMTYIN